ncbi:MAG: BON domain-containing protein [Ottowia sp.]|nr:BON domain-containing protein [Ottowia sp.]
MRIRVLTSLFKACAANYFPCERKIHTYMQNLSLHPLYAIQKRTALFLQRNINAKHLPIQAKQSPRARSLYVLIYGLLFSTLGLSACAPLMIGAAAGGGAAVLADRRSTGVQAIDRGLQLEAQNLLESRLDKPTNIDISVFNRKLLVTGEVATQELKQEAEKVLLQLQNPREVINELHVGAVKGMGTRIQDTYLTSSVKTALIATRGVPSNSMRITTTSSIVYLMGLVTEDEGNIAAKVASSVAGVARVVKLFDYISIADRDYLERRSTSTNPASATERVTESTSPDAARFSPTSAQ